MVPRTNSDANEFHEIVVSLGRFRSILDEFQFGRLENSIIEIGNAT